MPLEVCTNCTATVNGNSTRSFSKWALQLNNGSLTSNQARVADGPADVIFKCVNTQGSICMCDTALGCFSSNVAGVRVFGYFRPDGDVQVAIYPLNAAVFTQNGSDIVPPSNQSAPLDLFYTNTG